MPMLLAALAVWLVPTIDYAVSMVRKAKVTAASSY